MEPLRVCNDNPILLNDPLGLTSDTTILPAVIVTPSGPKLTPTEVRSVNSNSTSSVPNPAGASATTSLPSGRLPGTPPKVYPKDFLAYFHGLTDNLDKPQDIDEWYDGWIFEKIRNTAVIGPGFWDYVLQTGSKGRNVFGEKVYPNYQGGTVDVGVRGMGNMKSLLAGISKTLRVENSVAHILQAKHKLDLLLPIAGSRINIIKRLYLSVFKSGLLPAAGKFEITTVIYGYNVTIRGAVVDGIPRIGTAFIP